MIAGGPGSGLDGMAKSVELRSNLVLLDSTS